MIVTYSPAGEMAQRWSYKAAELPSSEAEDIEEAVGLTFDEWQQRLLRGAARARRALLWVLLKRDQPGLKFAELSFSMGELEVEFDQEEKQRIRSEAEKSTELTEEERQQLLTLLADEEEQDSGKDLSTPGSPTGAGG